MVTRGDVGRVLAASLHEAVAEVLPMRLEFYEEWLRPEHLRAGRLGLAPLNAVLSFLRKEGAAYAEVMAYAGAHAAAWTVSDLSAPRRGLLRAAPAWLRRRLVLRLARRLVRQSVPRSDARTRWRRGVGTFDIHGSVFCAVREPGETPLCAFYAAAIAGLMDAFGVPVSVETAQCRATGAGHCLMTVHSGT